ncbi:MAG: MFS transporter [Pseudooceanicola sp.]|nr:MFS transporter [Pseudooceanicola sp.]
MLAALRTNPAWRRLFAAQVIALSGTGLATVALGLLAWQIAGDAAGQVLGTALAIKMIAYVTLSPIAAALTVHLPRKPLLVALDLLRAAVVLLLPFVTQVWQVYVLIFVLQAASAAFTPAFQALIPEVLPEEADYTRALSLSRLAYDLESLLSPMLAAALLTVVSFPVLFLGTVAGFLGSALMVLRAPLPPRAPVPQRGIWDRTTRGLRLYLGTPRLRGLLAVNFAVAAAGAMVLVNTVVLVKSAFGLGEPQVALALAAFGGGSMAAALALPRLLDRWPERPPMLGGPALMALAVALGPLATALPALMALWLLAGLGYGLALTPGGRLLRRSGTRDDLAALFAAHFALSHACWLLTYPLAGWLGTAAGMPATFLTLAALSLLGLVTALRLWPATETALLHAHEGLPADHPHLRDHGTPHAHGRRADALHPQWPPAR